MPRGDKSKYTGKQQRQAEHIEESYEKRGIGDKEAEKRAWATVNKTTHGGKQRGGGGYGKEEDHSSERKGGKKASAARKTNTRKPSANQNKIAAPSGSSRSRTIKSDSKKNKATGKKTSPHTGRGSRRGKSLSMKGQIIAWKAKASNKKNSDGLPAGKSVAHGSAGSSKSKPRAKKIGRKPSVRKVSTSVRRSANKSKSSSRKPQTNKKAKQAK